MAENSGDTPYLCASAENNAVSSHIAYDAKLIEPGNCVFIGGKTFVVTYQERDFYSNDSHNLALYLKDSQRATRGNLLFIASCIVRSLGSKYTWGNSISHSKIMGDAVSLPVKSPGEIDFDFMETFIRELEDERILLLDTYLKASGLDNCKLFEPERQALEGFDGMEWREFSFGEIFDHIKQGRRLKRDDQMPGDIPFVMSGVTNAGVVSHVSNPIAVFPGNSITVDIFGNTFYRSYGFGAGDDTGVYWSKSKNYSKDGMLFLAAAMERAIRGRFSYGKKLRSSQSNGISMLLPASGDTPDYATMEVLIRAVKKLVVQDAANYASRRTAS